VSRPIKTAARGNLGGLVRHVQKIAKVADFLRVEGQNLIDSQFSQPKRDGDKDSSSKREDKL